MGLSVPRPFHACLSGSQGFCRGGLIRVLKALTIQPSSQSTQAGSPTWLELPDRSLHSPVLQSQQFPKSLSRQGRVLGAGVHAGLGAAAPTVVLRTCPPSALWTLGLMSCVANETAGPKGPRCNPLPGRPQGPEHMPPPKDSKAQR